MPVRLNRTAVTAVVAATRAVFVVLQLSLPSIKITLSIVGWGMEA
jgi:hypothetical protein